MGLDHRRQLPSDRLTSELGEGFLGASPYPVCPISILLQPRQGTCLIFCLFPTIPHIKSVTFPQPSCYLSHAPLQMDPPASSPHLPSTLPLPSSRHPSQSTLLYTIPPQPSHVHGCHHCHLTTTHCRLPTHPRLSVSHPLQLAQSLSSLHHSHCYQEFSIQPQEPRSTM